MRFILLLILLIYSFPVQASIYDMVTAAAKSAGIPVSVAHATVKRESRYRPNVTGRGGEIGLMQIKYRTARGMGYKGSRSALYDPATNLFWGMAYLKKAIRCGGARLYISGIGRC